MSKISRLLLALGIIALSQLFIARGQSNQTVTNLNNSGAGSLRDAILNSSAGAMISFAPGLVGTITLATGDLVIDHSLTINGPGARFITIDAGKNGRTFYVQAGTVTISNLMITNGYSGRSLMGRPAVIH